MTQHPRSFVSRACTATRWRAGIAGAVLALAGPGMALAANAPFPTVTTPVKLNGQAVNSDIAASGWRNTIVFESGQYHMWYVGTDYLMSGIQHATSTDGVNFTTAGSLTVPGGWWTSGGATVEPTINYIRVSRDGSGNWILMVWHPSDTGVGNYNYNTSLWSIGSNITNTVLTAIGPLPSFPGGNHVGPYGIVGSEIYLGQDTAQAFGRYILSPAPVTIPSGSMQDAADAYAGTGLCSFATLTCGGTANSSYIHNYGRTLDQGGGVLGTYYTLYDYNTFSRRAKQLWYLESTNGGTTWGSAQPLFTNGAAVTVDGLPNTKNFSLPEVAALGGGQYRSYFNTADACGNSVTVTAAPAGSALGPMVAKAFNPSTIDPGGESELTVTLSAPAATCTPAPLGAIYTGLGFTDTLPSGVTLAVAPGASTTCTGASLTANSGAGAFSLSAASLAAGASCTVTVRVTAAGVGTFRNVISATGLINTQGVPALADAVAELRSGVPAANVNPVPTLGEMATILLAMLLGGLGLRQLRPGATPNRRR